MDLKPNGNPLLAVNKADPVINCADIKAPFTHKGHIPTSRDIRKFQRLETAGEALGTIYPGFSFFGVTKGQFSLIELIAAIVAQTGPAYWLCSTWTAALADLNDVIKLSKSGLVVEIRFLVDGSYPRRKPQSAARMIEYFGQAAVRVTRNHSKFHLISNEKWKITVMTSMNLNTNPSLEHYVIQDDPALAGYIQSFFDEIFKVRKETDFFDPAYINEKRFNKI